MDERQHQKTASGFVIRPAAAGDYAAFARLFPELGVDDPVATPQVWASVIVPESSVAVAGDEVVGYCYFQEYDDTGYVRAIVVAPEARRHGVGRALMSTIADRLRNSGKVSWALNVRPDNHAALTLYGRMGLGVRYSTTALRLPWSALQASPAALPRGGSAMMRELLPPRDGIVEALFDLPRGQLRHARGLGRLVIEAVSGPGEKATGVAVLDPRFPGAFPFRVTETDAVAPLLEAIRVHVPAHEFVNVVAEDDARLVALLTRIGAFVRDQILHLKGSL